MSATNDLLLRAADFHLGALVLLATGAAIGRLLRQPVHRLTLAWGTVGALTLLLCVSQVPGRSLWHLADASPVAEQAPREPLAVAPPRAVEPAEPVPRATPQPPAAREAVSTTARPRAVERSVPPAAPVDWASVGSFLAFLLLATGSGVAVTWLFAGWVLGRRLVGSAWVPERRLESLLHECVDGRSAPRLRISDRLSAPLALGFWRPTILLPEHLAKGSGDGDLRAMLAHEWAHIRRGDLWLLAALRIFLVVLWPNPLYWLLRRRVRLDQEALADATAADLTDRVAYAERLVDWARTLPERSAGPRLAGAAGMWESRSQLRQRVALLLDDRFIVLRRTGLRWRAACSLACGTVAIAASLVTFSPAADPPAKVNTAALAELAGGQQMLELPVQVIDAAGRSVAGAKVTPWALRSSQGHGFWSEDDERAGVGPETVVTGADGIAMVLYPRFRHVTERTRTTSVSLHVDHPDFAYIGDDLHIDVPLEGNAPHEVELTRGVPVEVRPTIDGRPADRDELFAVWSDGRSWLPGAAPEKTADGALRIPAMPPGAGSLLLARLDGERATHFSDLTDFELAAGEPKRIDLPMRPARRIEGALSGNVPRPVRGGRVKVQTIPPAGADFDRVFWFTWAPIRPDGTFTIDGWPAGEPLQLIALCDGYIAASGEAPAAVENPRDPAEDPYHRPQVFGPADGERIEVTMTPLVRCVATTVDEDGEPVAGVTVASSPNVGWWNLGSQIYGHPLVRGERLLRERDFRKAIDEAFPPPFQGETGARGQVTLELPAGSESLVVISDVYELPVFLGRRRIEVELTPGEKTEVALRLQPRGTEQLGQWDKLAGVVFGCSTREGRRICALPGVREKMDEFAERFREAKNQRDPQLLSEAYAMVADAFLGVDDREEAAKWRQKAAEQAAKAKETETTAAEQSAAKPTAAEATPTATNATATQLTGVVVDEVGRPLEGVTVDAWTWYPGNETKTDAQGRFLLDGFDRGEAVEVLFSKDEYSPSLFVAQEAGTDDWTVVLRQGTWIEGRVLSPTGDPVPDVLVKASRGPFRNPQVYITEVTTTTRTDDEGAFRLHLEPSSYDVQVRVPESGAARVQGVRLTPKEKKTLDIQLDRGVTFQATVRNSVTGEPVEGIVLWNWREPGVEGVTNADGRLEITTMPEGEFTFNVAGEDRRKSSVADDYARWWSPEAVEEHQREAIPDGDRFQRNFDDLTFDLNAGMQPVEIFVEPAVQISGVVLDPDGNPVPGATVAPAKSGSGNSITGDTRFSYRTDEAGRFTVKLPASKNAVYNLVAHDGDYRQWRYWANGLGEPLSTVPGQVIDGVELRLTPPGTVRGRVLDREGNPRPSVHVRAAAFDKRDNRYYHPMTQTDQQGHYELRFIRPGKHFIQIEPFRLDAAQAPESTTQLVDVRAGATVEGIDFQADAKE